MSFSFFFTYNFCFDFKSIFLEFNRKGSIYKQENRLQLLFKQLKGNFIIIKKILIGK